MVEQHIDSRVTKSAGEASLAPFEGRDSGNWREDSKEERDDGSEPCPLCGRAGPRQWLRAPDRLHGRGVHYRLVRCPDCSLAWLADPPKPEEMYLHYTEAYHNLISVGGDTAPHRWRARKATITRYKQQGALLDLGCSSGSFLESLRGGPWKLYGVEMSAEAARAAEARSGAQVFTGSVLDTGFPAGNFDVITCFDVLEHLYEPRKVMTQVARWIKPGGIFYVLVPNVDSAEARVFRSYWHGLEMPRHLFHYSPASLRYLARTAGLGEVFVETHRNQAVGASLRYVFEDILQCVGIRQTPLAYCGKARLPWRVARKLGRETILRLALAMAPLVGGGESIHAVFRKEN